jgi:hypothetical protein
LIDYTSERRGAIAALGVAATIGILMVVLQPGPRPPRLAGVEAAAPTTSSTTTLSPGVQVCNLAKRFVHDAEGLEPNDVARIAEVFYVDAVKLVDGSARAEFDAAARYYVEYNQIGGEYDYDVFRIAAAGKGDRWAQLLFRPPLGIETARAAMTFACRVDLPPPPTLTTLPPVEEPPFGPSTTLGAPGTGAPTPTTAPSAPPTTA